MKTAALALTMMTGVAICLAQDAADPEPPTARLTKPFLGLHLGCSVEEALRAVKDGELPAAFVERRAEGEDTHYTFTGNHVLKGAATTILTFWQGKLWLIFVAFQGDGAGLMYDELRMQIELEHGEMTPDVDTPGGRQCQLETHGIGIGLQCQESVATGVQTRLTAAHVGIVAVKRKAKETGKRRLNRLTRP